MRFFGLSTNVLILILVVFASQIFASQIAQAQDRFVSLEVYSGQREALGSMQKWMEVLNKCGIDRVRAKSSQAPPALNVEESKEGRSSSIYVIGRIVGRKLAVPGHTFDITNVAGITAYFDGLKKDGAKVALAEKLAFGLTSEQLVSVHKRLSAKIEDPTKGENVGTVVSKLLGKQEYATAFDETASRALNGNDSVAEELQGLSIGTGIAAIIRPLGLVLQPRRSQGQAIKLHIVAFESADENWPVGWPNEDPVSQVAPKLFDRLDLEIRGFTLSQTLAALESRLNVPFLFDHNGMARQGIEPEETKVTYVKKKVAYMVAIRKLLSQSKPQLKHELRLDENGKPFLWIAPMSKR